MRQSRELELWVPTWPDRHIFLAATRASRRLHRGWVSPPLRQDEYRRLLATFGERHQAFLLWNRREEMMVGYVSLSQIVRSERRRSAILGYWGVGAMQGRGWMTRGVALVLEHAFKALRLQRIEAHVRPDNAPSLALLGRLSFHHEGIARQYLRYGGVWRDCEQLSMTRDAWRAAGTAKVVLARASQRSSGKKL